MEKDRTREKGRSSGIPAADDVELEYVGGKCLPSFPGKLRILAGGFIYERDGRCYHFKHPEPDDVIAAGRYLAFLVTVEAPGHGPAGPVRHVDLEDNNERRLAALVISGSFEKEKENKLYREVRRDLFWAWMSISRFLCACELSEAGDLDPDDGGGGDPAAVSEFLETFRERLSSSVELKRRLGTLPGAESLKEDEEVDLPENNDDDLLRRTGRSVVCHISSKGDDDPLREKVTDYRKDLGVVNLTPCGVTTCFIQQKGGKELFTGRRVHCKSFNCDWCGPYKRAQEHAHILRVTDDVVDELVTEEGSQTEKPAPVYFEVVAQAGWGPWVRQKAKRNEGNYRWYLTRRGYEVFSSFPLQEDAYAVSDREELEGILRSALVNLQPSNKNKHVVGGSRGWKLHEAKPEQKSADYVGYTRETPDEIASEARELSLSVTLLEPVTEYYLEDGEHHNFVSVELGSSSALSLNRFFIKIGLKEPAAARRAGA